MKRKYNIALRPKTQQTAIIAVADCLAPIADEYRLGDRSLPHVTLYQFYAEEEDIEKIWNKTMQLFDMSTIVLTFDQLGFITLDNSIFWIWLQPNCHSLLNEMHERVASILNKPIYPKFDPHMTLISSRDKEYQNTGSRLASNYKPITDSFQISLGLSDEIGQYLKDIYYCHDGKVSSNSGDIYKETTS